MLEDACLLNNTSFLPSCSTSTPSCWPRDKPGARAPRDSQCDHRPASDDGSYVAAPQLVMQSGPLALIISGAAISVARRNLDGCT